MMKSRFHLILGVAGGLIVPLLVFAKVDESVDQSCQLQPHGKAFMRTELFFGFAKPDRSEVTQVEFQQFVDRVVTPLFPEGLTRVAAKGQYRNSQGKVVAENSQLLTLLYPMNVESSKKIDQIRAAYKQAFQQESVLRVDERSCVSF
ncbi:DUF3574 domain-containing protein [Leptolyngbya boryana CZ1]|jgi:hypothetical protein|uniref:DUF3574 domain-containing protein n=2 Tax=Leptolyngbya boryana TaxID=1184 RepID=A0A1Z4JAB1_LEPBY|nr:MULTISPECIES: DUF3574 domain-containing protein [Leptolyngbya]BAY53608.1 hypothetical protein NIES2135_04140 [Leptolyngbya boryana NIES-2135]ULP30571.1 DUF3574 domain-containing protein [Leptolyngbya boryana IU 594]WNZ48887.1 DUF3574 domain-containing protein [Leptolyngbya boryana CZ1]BAS54333.1 hypothetical protein LBWT_2240 [Leptolyngbya boryana IAM M-101]BAS60681.1 hypothetical protein LBDG_02240 [Leptolyngbya boryana dg5]